VNGDVLCLREPLFIYTGLAGRSQMEQNDILPVRIRRLVIATGIASALALFPIFFLLYPALLIVGGVIQPRYAIAGKWFVWAGSIGLGPVLITYDVMLFPHPFVQPGYATLIFLMFPAVTVLLLWCYAELVVEGIAGMRAKHSLPCPETRRVGWNAWIVAVSLSLWIGRGVYGFVNGYYSGDHRLTPPVLVAAAMTLPLAVIVAAFDISLVRRVIRLRHTPHA
jgi:hypothetical protein